MYVPKPGLSAPIGGAGVLAATGYSFGLTLAIALAAIAAGALLFRMQYVAGKQQASRNQRARHCGD